MAVDCQPGASVSVQAGIQLAGCGDVELCVYATRAKEAIRLVELGARAGLVCQLTGLEKSVVHRLVRQLRGSPTAPGQTPFTDAWYREDSRRMLQASVVWRLHQRLARTGRSAARVLIDVYESYRCIVRQPLLDMTRVAFVPRLLAMQIWHERRCTHCRTRYVTSVVGRETACPGCRLYYRHRCRGCGAPLAAPGRGRRRERCASCQRRHRLNGSSGRAA